MISEMLIRRLVIAVSILFVAGIASGIPPEEDDPQELLANENVALEQRQKYFDQQMYQGHNPKVARDGLKKRLKRRLVEINKLCELTPDQSQKLELSGQLDIKRRFDSIEAHRRDFESRDMTAADMERRMIELVPLKIPYALASSSDVFRERSLMHKTAMTTLLPDQLGRYQSEMDKRFRSRLSTVQKSALKTFNGRKSLDDDQRRELLKLWNELPCATSGPADAMVFLHLASRIPEKKYRDILDERQWEVLQNTFVTAKHYGPALAQLGVIDDPDASTQENP